MKQEYDLSGRVIAGIPLMEERAKTNYPDPPRDYIRRDGLLSVEHAREIEGKMGIWLQNMAIIMPNPTYAVVVPEFNEMGTGADVLYKFTARGKKRRERMKLKSCDLELIQVKASHNSETGHTIEPSDQKMVDLVAESYLDKSICTAKAYILPDPNHDRCMNGQKRKRNGVVDEHLWGEEFWYVIGVNWSDVLERLLDHYIKIALAYRKTKRGKYILLPDERVWADYISPWADIYETWK